MATSPPTDLTTYHGNCHCGAVRFTVRIPSLAAHEVGSCDCSICTRNGYLMVYPEVGNFAFQQGLDNLTDFSFGSGKIVHQFCTTCGTSIRAAMTENREEMAFNVRTLHDVHPEDLTLKYNHGKDRGAPYTSPTFPEAPFTDSNADLVEYPANCQCGAVTYTLRLPSLATDTVNQCNCSICDRNAYLLVYPPVRNVAFHTGYEGLSAYSFNTKKLVHKFCGTCGSSIFFDMTGRGEDEWGMNVRMLKDVDLKAFAYTHYAGRVLMQPPYSIGKPAAT